MKESTIRYLLGAYHIIAGLAGIAPVLWLLGPLWAQTPSASRVAVAGIMSGIAAMFLIVVAAGLLLLRSRAGAIRLATAIQLLQIPVCTVGVWQWRFFAGIYVVVVTSNTRDSLGLELGLKSLLTVSWAGELSAISSIGLNVAPIGVLWVLWRLARTTKAGRLPTGSAVAGAPAT
jgi:hypothetical protein